MIGRSEIPSHRRPDDGKWCGWYQASYLRDIPGEHVRRCRACHATFIALVTVATHASQKCGREVLKVEWLDVQREAVS